MNASDDLSPAPAGRRNTVKGRPEHIEVTGRIPRIVKADVVISVGLLIWWPLVILALVFIVPAVAVAAVLAAVVAPIWLLGRRLNVHHRPHRSTPFVRRARS